MSLDVLLASLRREAETERDAVLAAARAEAEQLSAEADRRTGAQRAGAVAARRAELMADVERRTGAARRAARHTVLQARQQLLDRVFAHAIELLPAAGLAADYRAGLPGRLARALVFAGAEPVEILCPTGLVPALGELVAGRPGVVVRATDGIRAGLRVRTSDGRVDIDDTLEAQLEARRTELSRAVLAELCVAA